MKKHLSTLLVSSSLLILLSSCSNYSFTSNLDKENIKNYFAPTSVTIYKNNTQLPKIKEYIAAVEGESCQIKISDASANKIDARTQARRNAYNLKANAVVFTGCTQAQTKQCAQLIICYAKAYQVQEQ